MDNNNNNNSIIFDAMKSGVTDKPTTSGTSQSDEEVILAASRPKKRAGRRVFKETRHPVYRGVRRRNNDKWVCELREPGTQTRIWLGTYPTPEMAARAHDVAALALRGKSACLNFADSAWRLPAPASTDAKDIRRAAAEAAEAFRPRPYGAEAVAAETAKGREAAEGDEEEEERVFYMDEEAVFDMPRLFADLAQGLLLPPPPSSYMDIDDVGSGDDVSLWSYSI